LVPVALSGQNAASEESLRSESSTRETARFLLTPIGARSVGLAGAITASRAEAEGVLWNPASVAALDRSALFFHVANDFGTSTQVLGFLWNWRKAELGLTYYHFDMGTIEARDNGNQDIGTLDLQDDAFIVTAGYALTPDVDLGINYKFVRLSSACSDDCGGFDQRSTGHAFDLGTVIEIPSARGLSLGLVLRNLGTGVRFGDAGTSDPMPTRLRLGAGFDVTGSLMPEEERFGVLLQGDMQQTVSEFDDLEGYLGTEFSLRRILYLRAGYAWASAGRSGLALGIGLRYDRLALDMGRAFDDFAGFDSDSPFQLSLAFLF
jgi:hypothetical protein